MIFLKKNVMFLCFSLGKDFFSSQFKAVTGTFLKSGIGAQFCNLSTWEAELGGLLQVSGQPGLQSDTCIKTLLIS